MKYYQFYKSPALDAKVGIGMKRGRFTFYFPAKGMSKRKGGNVARNPDRLELHHKLIETQQICPLASALIVETYQAGKAVDGRQVITEPCGAFETVEFSDFLPRDIKGRGNYAYTLRLKVARDWLPEAYPPEEQCKRLARYLGLEPTTNARKVSI